MYSTDTSVSLVITGLFKSRFGRVGNTEITKKSLKMFKALNKANQIVVSTYKNEIPKDFFQFIDDVKYIKDPGPDNYSYFPKNISKINTVNFTRMARTAIEGISLAKNNFVIKTRVELIPFDMFQFKKWKKSETTRFNNKNQIGFFLEFYSGIGFSIDGVFGNLPDVLHYGEKEILARLWSNALMLWEKNLSFFRKQKFPITSDQCLGLSYLQLYCGYNPEKKLRKLRRYTLDTNLLCSLKLAENDFYRISSYKLSGFTVNYFSGSFAVNKKIVSIPDSNLKTTILIMFALAKRIKMYFKRYSRAIKIEYRSRFKV